MGKQSFTAEQAKRGNLWNFDPSHLVVIGVDTKDGPQHELYDERIHLPLDEPMVLNLMALGVRESICIRKNAKGNPEVMDGRRRVLHAREANKRLKKAGEPLLVIPAILSHADEMLSQTVAISMNEIRVDDPIMIKVAKCQRMLLRNGGDNKAAAVAFGVSTVTIKNWMKISELSSKVKKAIDRGEISASAAAQLHGMEKEQQHAELEKLTASAKKNGKKRATAKKAAKAAGKKGAAAPGKRILMKLLTDEDLSVLVEPEVAYGIKLALGERIPAQGSKMGKLLVKAGYEY